MPQFDAQVIANLFLELYAVLISLFYLDPARLSLPSYKISESTLQKFATDMDPVALNLIKQLPYIKELYPIMIALGTKSVNLAYDLGYAQGPMGLEGAEGDYVEKWSVCLTNGLDEGASGWLVLDTKKYTITKVKWDNMNGKPADTPLYYYNWQQAVPAEEILQGWIRRYIELEWIPWEGQIPQAEGPPEDQVHYHAMKALYQSHDWPNAYCKEEFTEARDTYITQERMKRRLREEPIGN